MKKEATSGYYLAIGFLISVLVSRCNPMPAPTLAPAASSKIATNAPTIASGPMAYKPWLSWKNNIIEGFAWSPSGQQFATVEGNTVDDTHIYLLDVSALRGSRFSEPAYDPAVTFSPNGEELVVGLSELEIWNVASKKLLGRSPANHTLFFAYLPGHNDSLLVATATPDNSWISDLDLRSIGNKWNFQPFLDIKGYLREIALNRNGSLLATTTKYFETAADDGEHVLVWDLAAKKEICIIHGLNVAFSTTDILGVAAADGISLWNARTCKKIRNFPPGPEYPERYPYNITFSPNGKLLALALHVNAVEILDSTTGQVVQKLNVIYDYADTIRFSPDGQFLATISRNEDLSEIETILIVWKLAGDSVAPVEVSPSFFTSQ